MKIIVGRLSEIRTVLRTRYWSGNSREFPNFVRKKSGNNSWAIAKTPCIRNFCCSMVIEVVSASIFEKFIPYSPVYSTHFFVFILVRKSRMRTIFGCVLPKGRFCCFGEKGKFTREPFFWGGSQIDKIGFQNTHLYFCRQILG